MTKRMTALAVSVVCLLALACNLSEFAFEGAEDVAFPDAGQGENLEDLMDTCLADSADYRWAFQDLDDDSGPRGQKCMVELMLENTGGVGQMWSIYRVIGDEVYEVEDWRMVSLAPGERFTEDNSHTHFTESAGGGETYELILRMLVYDDRPECVRVLPGASDEVDRAIGERILVLGNPCE
ncbi:MAG: hypothetical protein JXA97_12005 [Anaerolineales bacterium]|nr:hypothetical protein [Anaerolineales bacterium]